MTSFSSFVAPDARIAGEQETLLQALTEPELLVPTLQANTKIGAIKELVDRLHAKGVVGDSLAFLQAVLERERLQSTIVEMGMALPHARSRAVDQLSFTVGVFPEPIEYPSGDERQPIQLICLIAVPAHDPSAYLDLLEGLARIFSDGADRTSLLSADSADEMYRLLSSSPVA